jgi:hypothetical protein
MMNQAKFFWQDCTSVPFYKRRKVDWIGATDLISFGIVDFAPPTLFQRQNGEKIRFFCFQFLSGKKSKIINQRPCANECRQRAQPGRAQLSVHPNFFMTAAVVNQASII